MFSAAAFITVFCFVCSLTSAKAEISDETELNFFKYLATNYFYVTNSVYKSRSQKEGNILFAPLSIQIFELNCGPNVEDVSIDQHRAVEGKLVREEFQRIISSLEDDKNVTLHTDYSCDGRKETFSDSLTSETEHTSFVSIEHIRNLTTLTATTEDSPSTTDNPSKPVMILKNSFNFTGEWETKFDKANTKSEPFFVTPTQTQDVEMMHLTSDKVHLTVSQELDFKVLELPYKGDRVSLLVLLPNTVDGLANLESNLLKVNLTQLLNRTETHVVSVSLPKFKIEHSKISASPNNDTKGVENANFGINENGTDCVAATATPNEERISQSAVPEVFRADHPFLFVLLERENQILFLFGRVSSPGGSTEESDSNSSLNANTTA